jgi:membrane protein YqaA with SNARE-associated domain
MTMDALPAELAVYAALFLGALTSATLLPGASEAALLGLVAAGQGAPAVLVAVATIENVLGSVVNWALGRYLSRYREHWWFPVRGRSFDRGVALFRRWGAWSLLLSWMPVLDDPLTAAAGVLRESLSRFLLLVTIGKAARYVFVCRRLRLVDR